MDNVFKIAGDWMDENGFICTLSDRHIWIEIRNGQMFCIRDYAYNDPLQLISGYITNGCWRFSVDECDESTRLCLSKVGETAS
jgi:hypothetical protein